MYEDTHPRLPFSATMTSGGPSPASISRPRPPIDGTSTNYVVASTP